MIHYHGGPITPESCARRAWKARHAFVSWYEPRQLDLAIGIAQSFALDNGAFSYWKKDEAMDRAAWAGYYDWVKPLLNIPSCDWAIIPDVVGGTEAANDDLVGDWPFGHRGVPVWHLNESIDRLERLAADGWPRIALGSAAEYDVSKPSKAIERLAEALPSISDANGRPLVKLHGLRMLNPAITGHVPLASADSTNVARNIGMDNAWAGPYTPATKETRTDVLVERMEAVVTPSVMRPPSGQYELLLA